MLSNSVVQYIILRSSILAIVQKGRLLTLHHLQNSCLRFAYNLRKFDHISEYLSRFGWLTFHERFLSQLLAPIHKIKSYESSTYLFEKLTRSSDTHSINTHNKYNFSMPIHHTMILQRGFSYIAPKFYNSLHDNVKGTQSVGVFGGKVISCFCPFFLIV